MTGTYVALEYNQRVRLSFPGTSFDSAVNSTSDTSQRAARSLELALAAADTAEENEGRNIVVLDLRSVSPLFDYFVIASGTSRRQMHAMSEEIDHKLEDDLGDRRMSIEGYQDSRWILLDYGNIVVHLLDDEAREYYDLESLWAEATVVERPTAK